MAKNTEKAREQVVEAYKLSKEFYRSRRNEYEEIWQLAHGIPKTKRAKFNRFVPYIPAAIDLILPRLAGRLPTFEIVGVTPEDDPHARTMQKLVEYYMDKIDFHSFELRWIRSAVIYGTALAQIGWDLRKKTLHPDVAKRLGEEKKIVADEPLLKLIPIEMIYPHPRKVKVQDNWPLVIEEHVTMHDLKTDPNVDQSALKDIGDPVTDESELYFLQRNKQAQYRNAQRLDDKKQPVYQKLTYYGLHDGDDGEPVESVISVVNERVVVRNEQSPFWHQRTPFAKLDYNPDEHSFFNDGLVKQMKDLQLELNEIRNVRSKARAISLKAPLMVDRSANIDLDTAKWEPGAVMPYDAGYNREPIRPLEIPSRLLELEREEAAIKQDMQIRSGINDVVIGTSDVGVTGGDTATGASIAAEQTNLRFRTQGILIDQAMKEVGEQLVANLQQFIDRKKAFRVLGEGDGRRWEEIRPEDVRGENGKLFQFDFRVNPISTLVEPKTAKRERLLVLKNLYSKDVRVDQDKLDRMIFEAFDADPDQILKTPEEQMGDSQAGELEELSRTILDPKFAELPPEQQQMLTQQLMELRGQVSGRQAEALDNAAASVPQGIV